MLTIHIGTPKTGTTAIQRSLRSGDLTPHGLSVLRVPRAFFQPTPIAQVETVESDRVRRGRDELAALTAGAQPNTVLSYEGLCGDLEGGFRNSNVVATTLRDITDGHRTRIVIVFRPQDEFIESAYAQLVRAGVVAVDFGTYVEELSSDDFDWLRLAESYAERFSNVVCLRYSSDIVAEFSDLVGIPDLRCEQDFNPSATLEATDIMRSAKVGLDKQQQRILRDLLAAASLPETSKRTRLSADARATLIRTYEASNRELWRRFFGDEGALAPESRPRQVASFSASALTRAECRNGSSRENNAENPKPGRIQNSMIQPK